MRLKIDNSNMMRKSEFGMKNKYLWYLPKSLSIVFLVLLTISCGNEEKPKVNKTIKVEVMNVGLNTNNSQTKVAYNGTIEADVAIKRINNVFQKGSIAEIRMLEARSQYEQAQAAAKMTYENVRHAKLYAPMDGYVSDKMMDVGDLAQPGQSVVEIVNINAVKAVFPIPDGEINSITKGDSANVNLPTLDKSIIGIVDEVSIQSNQGSPVYTAYVKLNNPDKQIKPGMTCNVRLQDKVENGKNVKEVIVIPSESIAVTEDGKQYVYIVDNGIAERKYIETGELYDSGIVVKKGLAKGDHLIISGYHKLTQSTPVEIVNDAK